MAAALLTPRFEAALQLATQLHRQQLRKGTQVPYVAHLLSVAALVLEDGGDEDEAIAALLHDAPEDQGGRAILSRIRQEFGDRVADIVDGCTDTYESPKPPWQSRKQAYLEHLLQAGPEVRRVSLADKLHNARTILSDLRQHGPVIWERFNGQQIGTLWYYRSLVQVFRTFGPTPMLEELERVLSEIEHLAQEG